MHKLSTLFFVAFFGLFIPSFSQSVSVIKYDQLEQIIKSNNDELLVVNFWATWCGPCVKELPHFESLDTKPGIRVLLVSLDFPEELGKVTGLVERKALKSEVFLLDETDYDSYMRKVSEDWSGAIPATLFVRSDRKSFFYEKAFDEQSLEKTVTELMDKR